LLSLWKGRNRIIGIGTRINELVRWKLLENSAVSKTQKMKMFGSHNIKPLIALFNWTGERTHSF
jgi:hypothetical protein